MSTSKHTIRFPNESQAYRTARDKLLDAEIALRRQIETVAAQRRTLPLGGEVPEDYLFEEATPTASRSVHLSQLFANGKDTLLVYSFMFGPQMVNACPACTSILDALDGEVPHVEQRANLVVVAKSPIQRIHAFAQIRGWRHLRLLSSASCTYNQDYHTETAKGDQLPLLNVFVRRDERIHHSYSTELFYAPSDPGQHARHVDLIWPLWNLLDLTPEGRGEKWSPKLSY